IDFQASLIDPPTVFNASVSTHGPTDSELSVAVDRMTAAKRPIIWAGSGAMFSDSDRKVTALMESLDAAVITTQSGRGIVPETDSRCIGHFATFPAVQEFVGKSDLLISVGVRFRGNETSNWAIKTPPEHIGIDADPAAINRNFPHSFGLIGDAKTILSRLGAMLSTKELQEKLQYREEVAELRWTLRQEVRDTMGPW